jgi:hypothetical protein
MILAFRTSRRVWTVCVCLALGICLPVAFLWLGQPK